MMVIFPVPVHPSTRLPFYCWSLLNFQTNDFSPLIVLLNLSCWPPNFFKLYSSLGFYFFRLLHGSHHVIFAGKSFLLNIGVLTFLCVSLSPGDVTCFQYFNYLLDNEAQSSTQTSFPSSRPSGSQVGVFLFPLGRFGIVWSILFCQGWERCYWLLMGRF